MNKRLAYFVAAGLGALATLILLLFSEAEDVTTSVGLFIGWTVIMLVLGSGRRAAHATERRSAFHPKRTFTGR